MVVAVRAIDIMGDRMDFMEKVRMVENTMFKGVIIYSLLTGASSLHKSAVAHEQIAATLKKEVYNMDELIKEWEKSNEWFQDDELDGLKPLKEENGNKQDSKPSGRSNKQKGS